MNRYGLNGGVAGVLGLLLILAPLAVYAQEVEHEEEEEFAQARPNPMEQNTRMRRPADVERGAAVGLTPRQRLQGGAARVPMNRGVIQAPAPGAGQVGGAGR
ncbi:MAG: hypothetical protein B0D96_02900 [Candidatus Sedimenticola endophacoides]|nr:MAG: hypothetical protein B0D96_02900 [Candidatus Sedimenticola endophacoides]OQX42891.1 MAG: hypothetical protein B0D82_00300 [Candidatus Sedimenticola endophacoides]